MHHCEPVGRQPATLRSRSHSTLRDLSLSICPSCSRSASASAAPRLGSEWSLDLPVHSGPSFEPTQPRTGVATGRRRRRRRRWKLVPLGLLTLGWSWSRLRRHELRVASCELRVASRSLLDY
ncbi:hypothetical protein L226DRAFT_388008 [Lentinus tigrinus ALCF2SS1-7]|uniref:Uncharacterized protein n=1 Tax=Lentinus tigrinus ALCF2SS1-6 TaxID=1328759 RepID=A0A5C2S9N7_9APHY|nr:hypothetical protein L227DRAFT_89611 [Lentinus tigrinus ALCF2SS1-6]RPD75784.1 hypothetical protein L226DRAFT_388008 [Lentinus tigrinus ALCF2SS1-7]